LQQIEEALKKIKTSRRGRPQIASAAIEEKLRLDEKKKEWVARKRKKRKAREKGAPYQKT